jgi:hypothetical protein
MINKTFYTSKQVIIYIFTSAMKMVGGMDKIYLEVMTKKLNMDFCLQTSSNNVKILILIKMKNMIMKVMNRNKKKLDNSNNTSKNNSSSSNNININSNNINSSMNNNNNIINNFKKPIILVNGIVMYKICPMILNQYNNLPIFNNHK